MINTKMGFGAIPRVQKKEDVLIGSFAPATPTPAVFMPVYNGSIEMQYSTPSCGAHAGDSVKNVLETGFRGSPEYLWKRMRALDGLSPDTGSTLLSIMTALSKKGICSSSFLLNNANVSNALYADPSTLTPSMDADALNHKVGVYAFTFNPTFQQIKDAIYAHKAVILLLNVGEEWWKDKNGNGSWSEQGILPLSPTRPITSAHFVTAYAFDEKYIYFINSWSDAWGRKGIGYFGIDYVSRCGEMGTTVNPTITTYVFIKLLKIGMTGFDVKQLQTKLGITADGIFGQKTKQSVIAFQTKHGLVADGIVGNNTNKVLNTL